MPMKMKSVMKKMAKAKRAPLKFQTTQMHDHLEGALKKLRGKFGRSLKGVGYKQAQPIVGSTLAARLTARGFLERAAGGLGISLSRPTSGFSRAPSVPLSSKLPQDTAMAQVRSARDATAKPKWENADYQVSILITR